MYSVLVLRIYLGGPGRDDRYFVMRPDEQILFLGWWWSLASVELRDDCAVELR